MRDDGTRNISDKRKNKEKPWDKNDLYEKRLFHNLKERSKNGSVGEGGMITELHHCDARQQTCSS